MVKHCKGCLGGTLQRMTQMPMHPTMAGTIANFDGERMIITWNTIKRASQVFEYSCVMALHIARSVAEKVFAERYLHAVGNEQ